MSFAAGFLNAWKDNEATAERERLQQETKDARDSALATTAKNRQEDQEYRASRDAKQDQNQLDTLLSGRYTNLLAAKMAFQKSKKMPAGHAQNLLFMKDKFGDADSSGEIMAQLNQSPDAAKELRDTWTAGAKKGFTPTGDELVEAIGILAANPDEVSAYKEWQEGSDPFANLASLDLSDQAVYTESLAAYSSPALTRPEVTIVYSNRPAFGQGNFASPEEFNAEIKLFDNEILRMARMEVNNLSAGDGLSTNNPQILELNNAIEEYKDDPTVLQNKFGQLAFDELNNADMFAFPDSNKAFARYQGQDPEPRQDRPPKPTTEEEKSALQLVNEEADLANIPPNSWWITPDGQVMWKGNT